MFNLMVANCQKKGRYNRENIEIILKAQIENSINLGWDKKEIIIITNFRFEFMGVKTHKINLNKHCLTGSKMWALDYIFANDYYIDHEHEIWWAHDLDAWQNITFVPPKFKDVGITTYSTKKFNGGSTFWKAAARDIIHDIIMELKLGKEKEEPTLNKLLREEKYKERVTVIDNTYNVGCSGFVPRIIRAHKPICISHINPLNRIAWETHRLDRNGLGLVSISGSLESVLRKYYPHLAIKLSQEGLSRQSFLREKNQKHLKEMKT